MRPVSLHVAGFTAFRAATEVDFAGTDMFALTGPTGSGKSSIIDAVCFALYGSIPRLSGVAPVISLGKPEARVRLVFEVEGERWTVSRVVVRQGDGASQRDVRLEGPGVILDGVRDVDARIVGLLGLGFDHFTRTVVLPQGRFAAFLEDGPAAREKLLKQLLDLGVYEDMRKRGASHAARLEGDIAVVDAQLHDLLVDDGQVADMENRLERLRVLRERVAESAAAGEKAATTLREAREAREQVVTDLSRLAAVVPPTGLDRLGDQLREARRAVELGQQELAAAEAAGQDIGERRAELGELSALDRAIELHARVAELADRVARGKQLIDEAKANQERVAEELHAASSQVETAASRLQILEREHAAHAIRSQLSAGDACPVCLQSIPAIPPDEVPADLDAARAGVAEAVAARDAASQRVGAITAEVAKLEGHLEQRADELVAAQQAVAECLSLDAARQAREKAVALDEELAAHKAKVSEIRARQEAAGASLQQAEKAGWAASELLDRTRDGLAGLEPPMPQRTDPADDWQTFIAWREARSHALEMRRSEVEEEMERRTDELAEIQSRLQEMATEAGLEGVGEDVHVAVATAVATTELTLQQLRADLDRRREMENRRKGFDTERRRYDETSKLLRSNRFQQWLIEEALVGLVDFANVELEKLAGGAYSLVVDGGDFEVIDHRNAEARRSVKTLSGGETFLVSLALALALAERVVATSAVGTARIESMFLDEGFGTLDAETLEVVASVVQELGSRDRMVGIVTHVRELADQIPTRFEIKKLPDGATVTRIDT